MSAVSTSHIKSEPAKCLKPILFGDEISTLLNRCLHVVSLDGDRHPVMVRTALLAMPLLKLWAGQRSNILLSAYKAVPAVKVVIKDE